MAHHQHPNFFPITTRSSIVDSTNKLSDQQQQNCPDKIVQITPNTKSVNFHLSTNEDHNLQNSNQHFHVTQSTNMAIVDHFYPQFNDYQPSCLYSAERIHRDSPFQSLPEHHHLTSLCSILNNDKSNENYEAEELADDNVKQNDEFENNEVALKELKEKNLKNNYNVYRRNNPIDDIKNKTSLKNSSCLVNEQRSNSFSSSVSASSSNSNLQRSRSQAITKLTSTTINPTNMINNNSNERECANCLTRNTPLWRRYGPNNFLCNACGLYQRVNGNHRPLVRNIRRTTTTTTKRTGLCCANCGTKTTSMWRRNTFGESVCNACGLYFRLNGVNRPIEMRKEAIRTRKRRTKPMLMLRAMLGPDFFSKSSSNNPNELTEETSLEKLLNYKPEIILPSKLEDKLKEQEQEQQQTIITKQETTDNDDFEQNSKSSVDCKSNYIETQNPYNLDNSFNHHQWSSLSSSTYSEQSVLNYLDSNCETFSTPNNAFLNYQNNGISGGGENKSTENNLHHYEPLPTTSIGSVEHSNNHSALLYESSSIPYQSHHLNHQYMDPSHHFHHLHPINAASISISISTNHHHHHHHHQTNHNLHTANNHELLTTREHSGSGVGSTNNEQSIYAPSIVYPSS